jgi:hypothetical protein
MNTTASCELVTEQMASVLDGSAAPELLEHVTSCDACRDARYDAERGELLVSEAGRDFQLPVDFTARVTAGIPTKLPAPPTEAANLDVAPTDAAPITERLPPPALPAPAAPGAGAIATAKAKLKLPAFARRWAVPALAAAAAAALLIGRDKPARTSLDDFELSGPPWRGKVDKVLTRDGKLEVCAPSGSACRDARQGDEIPAGSLLRTDRSTLAELSFSDGSSLSLDRDTLVRLSTRGRGGELTKGGIVADIEHQPNTGVRFELKNGYVDVLGTKFSLRSDDDSAAVHVARGQVRLVDRSGRFAIVLPGEEGHGRELAAGG